MPLGKPLIEFDELPSTNSYLLDDISLCSQHGLTVWAHKQTHGRGRAGRTFISPSNQVLTFSVVIHSSDPEDRLHLWALWSGLALFRNLHGKGLSNLILKWPNDLLLDGRKTAGILIEADPLSAESTKLVVGVGINIGSFPQMDTIGQQATRIGRVSTLSREEIALVTIRAIDRAVKQFVMEGLSPIVERWREVDAYENQEVDLLIGENRVTGRNVGINHTGHLLIETPSGLREFSMGDVSLRPSVGENESE